MFEFTVPWGDQIEESHEKNKRVKSDAGTAVLEAELKSLLHTHRYGM